MELPRFGHAKFLILAALVDGRERTPEEVREAIGWDKAADYFTAKLEGLRRCGLVAKRKRRLPYRRVRRIARRPVVRITDASRRAWNEALDWYLFVARKAANDAKGR